MPILHTRNTRIHAKALRSNDQSSEPGRHPQLKRRATGEIYRSSDLQFRPHPSQVYATILDLNGNPIKRDQPCPVLRHTTSSRIFQPKTLTVARRESHKPELSTANLINTNSITTSIARNGFAQTKQSYEEKGQADHGLHCRISAPIRSLQKGSM